MNAPGGVSGLLEPVAWQPPLGTRYMRRRPASRPTRSGFVRLVAAALIVIATIGSMSSTAAAHAQLLETNPVNDTVLDEAPAAIELQFDEPMDIGPDAIRVVDPQGERVDTTAATTRDGDKTVTTNLDGTGRGTYTVGWRATSEDGHTLSGSFVFHVEVRTGARSIDEDRSPFISPVVGAGRWLSGAGLMAGIGAIALSFLAADGAARNGLRRFALWSLLAGVAGTLLTLWGQTAAASGRTLWSALPVVPDIGLASRTGALTGFRAIALASAAALIALSSRSRWLRYLAPVPLAAAVILSAMSGHPWTASERSIALVADASHLTAVGVWIGGAAALLLVARSAPEPMSTVRAFSKLALPMVLVVGVTGTVSTLYQVPNVGALWTTTYGKLLVGKILVVLTIIAIAAINRTRLLPHLETTLATVVRNVRYEVALAALALAFTAVLVDEPPARTTVDQPFATEVRAEQARVEVSVEPARVGSNTLHLYFYDQGTGAAYPVDAVEVTAGIGDIPPRKLTVVPVTPSHVSIYDAALAAPGIWTINITAVRGTQQDTFEVKAPIR